MVMPFGLKNVGATYQRAMTALFHDLMHQEVVVYVDDMIAKSKESEDHLTCLRKLFDCLRRYKFCLNPNKCVFGVSSGNTTVISSVRGESKWIPTKQEPS